MRRADRDDPLRDEVIAQAPAPERRPVFFSGIARVLALAADTVQPQFADDRGAMTGPSDSTIAAPGSSA